LCCVFWEFVATIVAWVSRHWWQTLKLLYFVELLLYLSCLFLLRASRGKWKWGMELRHSLASSSRTRSNNRRCVLFSCLIKREEEQQQKVRALLLPLLQFQVPIHPRSCCPDIHSIDVVLVA
jgi:hypothetical protein